MSSLKPARRSFSVVLSAVLSALVIPAVAAEPRSTPDVAELQLAIDRLGVLGSALYIAAHPDDENTALLAWLARGQLVRAGYLSLTRGGGGQNLIGSERGEFLGMLRTQELLAARGVDGAEQMFSRALDFGYSKSPEETLAIWDRDAILGDIVWAIRSFRPDIVITRFSPTYRETHGHHIASAMLAVEAFAAAADPARYPEQLAWVEPHQVRRLLWNAWRPGANAGDALPPDTYEVDVGGYNPVVGKSYGEIAAVSRSMHKCQGFGTAARRGTQSDRLQLLAGDPIPAGSASPFAGIALDWSRVQGADGIADQVRRVQAGFDPRIPADSLPALLELDRLLQVAPDSYWVERKRHEVRSLIRGASGLWLEALAEQPVVARGGSLEVRTLVLQRAGASLRLGAVEVTHGAAAAAGAAATGQVLVTNQPAQQNFAVTMPADAPLTRPYWLEEPPLPGLYRVADPRWIGRPESPPALVARFTLRTADDRKLVFEEPVQYRWTDPVRGELERAVEVVPALSLELDDDVYLFSDTGAKPIGVRLVSHAGERSATVRLQLPAGFTAVPAEAKVHLVGTADQQTVSFAVTPPAAAARGQIRVAAHSDGHTFTTSVVRIEYDHVPIRVHQPVAEASVVRVDLGTPRPRVGYVVGSGDDVTDALRQAGYDVTLIDDAALSSGAFDGYDVILVGIRAYNTRDRLATAQPRLLAWVEGGGTLVVQYNTSHRLLTDALGPYPLTLGRDRITDETAALELLAPEHPLFQSPNRITAADFDSWVQERGLYFADTWDDRYQPLLSGHDPGEPITRGALLYARYGKGVTIVTGLSFFRQLPAGVPGAYRLLANLLAAK